MHLFSLLVCWEWFLFIYIFLLLNQGTVFSNVSLHLLQLPYGFSPILFCYGELHWLTNFQAHENNLVQDGMRNVGAYKDRL